MGGGAGRDCMNGEERAGGWERGIEGGREGGGFRGAIEERKCIASGQRRVLRGIDRFVCKSPLSAGNGGIRCSSKAHSPPFTPSLPPSLVPSPAPSLPLPLTIGVHDDIDLSTHLSRPQLEGA
jgi:hypothetical protein